MNYVVVVRLEFANNIYIERICDFTSCFPRQTRPEELVPAFE